MDVFESLDLFLSRLSIYIQHDITHPLKEVIVRTLAQTILTLGMVTNLIKEKRSGMSYIHCNYQAELTRCSQSYFCKTIDWEE